MNAPARYPFEPGHRGDVASIEAAEKVKPFTGRLHKLVLQIVEAAPDGLTSEQIEQLAADIAPGSSIEPRVVELRKRGFLIRTGERRPNKSGIRAHVLKLAPAKGGDNDAAAQ